LKEKENNEMKIYLATPSLSESEVMFSNALREELISMRHKVYIPQRGISPNNNEDDLNDPVISFERDSEELENADILVALLNGLIIDPDVAAEIGYMAAKEKDVVALLTDGNEFSYKHLYVIGAIKKDGVLFNNRDALIRYLGGKNPSAKYKIYDKVFIRINDGSEEILGTIVTNALLMNDGSIEFRVRYGNEKDDIIDVNETMIIRKESNDSIN